MDYSKCWLDYQPVDTIEKELLTYFQSCEGEIVESAVSEYKLAMENMAGKVPQTVTKEDPLTARLEHLSLLQLLLVL